MTRRSLVRVLLSLLLLMSQQMALSHVVAHWSGRSTPVAAQHRAGDGEGARSLVQDQWCDQCLAFAQIAGAVGSTPRAIVPFRPASNPIPGAAALPACARTVCAFRSRAPPAWA